MPVLASKFFQRQDAANTLYNSATISANGISSPLDYGCIGGLPPSEIAMFVSGLNGTASLTFVLQDYINGAFVDTDYQIVIPALQNGVTVTQIDNRMITGSKFQLRHVYTAGTATTPPVVTANVRPSSLQWQN